MEQEVRKMRKGLWSPEEDEKLRNCIAMYKKGSWSDIAKRAGLQRCGKSCRRRWMNHLRPGLKRGRFTPLEITLVLELHCTLGNRWSEIAGHLVGRTDNDVKNLWNTQIKRRLNKLSSQQSQFLNHYLHKPVPVPRVFANQEDDGSKLIMLQRSSADTAGTRAPKSSSTGLHNARVRVLEEFQALPVTSLNKGDSLMSLVHAVPHHPENITSDVAPTSSHGVSQGTQNRCCTEQVICAHTFSLPDYVAATPLHTEPQAFSLALNPKEFFADDWCLPLLSDDDALTLPYNAPPTFLPLV